ncbi:MAG TPA: PQQ-binding-like beta-propeller repeat protein [Kofleriaceae bacterium]|nr:PQQ-binding-like beta-propeller repeat protein [Kofleriaceae bacterium]
MRAARTLALLALLEAGAAGGCAATQATGVVFADLDGDGVREQGEPGVPGVVVATEGAARARTDAKGQFVLPFAMPDEIVWARVPDGFRPGPAWTRASAAYVELGVRPLTDAELETPLTFVVAADTHTTAMSGPWDGGDLEDALSQAVALDVPPRFFTIVGDVTQDGPGDFARVDAALTNIDVPWVPVPGGHDWFDGGAAWRATWGPPDYSFDVGNLHFIVWDTNASAEDQVRFFQEDLADVDRSMTVVALGHQPPPSAVAQQLADLGVKYLFTGHWHANRRVDLDGLVEWGTQNLVMGTIDQSPSGYRIVTFTGGVPIVEHRTRLNEPVLAVASPHEGSCASPRGFPLLVSAALDAAVPRVTARLDCGAPVSLAPRGIGGWSYQTDVGALAPGTHSVDLVAESSSGRRLERRFAFEVCDAPAAKPVVDDWPQLGGGPGHAGAAARTIAPPLAQQWAASVGGNVLLGTPVIANGTVVVSVWDLGAGDRGGLVALDLATGKEKWRFTTRSQTRAAPAIAGDTVVTVTSTGTVSALSLADGSLRWQGEVSTGLDRIAASVWGPPAIANGIVYVAVAGRAVALDLATGATMWKRDIANVFPWLGSLAAPTVADGTVVTTYDRDDGMTAWDAAGGGQRWADATDSAVAVNASPVAADGKLYVIDSSGDVTAYDTASGRKLWVRGTTPGSDPWMYTVTATPVLAGGRLVVPTEWEDLVALDAATGAERWRVKAAGGPLNFAHYRGDQAGYPASPVATGDVLWVPGIDGSLTALDLADGHERWKTQLGAPVVSAPAPAGDVLVVATYDGTVRAFVHGEERSPRMPDACPPVVLDKPAAAAGEAADAGCCETSSGRSPLGALACAALVAALLPARRRAARPKQPA